MRWGSCVRGLMRLTSPSPATSPGLNRFRPWPVTVVGLGPVTVVITWAWLLFSMLSLVTVMFVFVVFDDLLY
jgi:hypothetical protein